MGRSAWDQEVTMSRPRTYPSAWLRMTGHAPRNDGYYGGLLHNEEPRRIAGQAYKSATLRFLRAGSTDGE